MTGVFAAFALSDVANMRQLGVGLAVAVLLDATVVRLILLPAIIRLAGGACWWLPQGLGRILRADAPAPAEEMPKPDGDVARRQAFARFGEFAGHEQRELAAGGERSTR